MSTATRAPASPQTQPALDLDARLALAEAGMNVLLDRAADEFAARTKHLPGADPVPHIAEIVPHPPAAAPSPYQTPLADLLHCARIRLETDGWCRTAVHDESGAVCPIQAIRLEARGDRNLAHDACVALLDAIQARYPHAETIPSWNAEQTSAGPVLAAFQQATDHAHTRQI